MGFQKVSQSAGLPCPPLLSCFLFPIPVKQLQSGLGRAPKCRFALLWGLLFPASSKTGMWNPGHLRPPAALTPADASFPFEGGASDLGAAVGLFDGEGAWGCHPLLQLLLTQVTILPSLPLPPSISSSLLLAPFRTGGQLLQSALLGRSPLTSRRNCPILSPSWFWGPLKACVSVSPVPQSSLSCPGLGSACVRFALCHPFLCLLPGFLSLFHTSIWVWCPLG